MRGRSTSRESQYPENTTRNDRVVVDLDQFQELVLIETGSDVTNAENMINLLKTAQHQN